MIKINHLSTPVITLDDHLFASECSRLAKSIEERFPPDLIIGIPTGGDLMAKNIRSQNFFEGIPYTTALLQRTSSQIKKKSKISLILKKLPRPLTNTLRRIESTAREFKFEKTSKSIAPRIPIVSPDALKLINDSHKILILDDAIDSGATMAGVVALVKNANPKAQLYTAVLTTTFKSPLIKADLSVYHATLLRFPWSEDF